MAETNKPKSFNSKGIGAAKNSRSTKKSKPQTSVNDSTKKSQAIPQEVANRMAKRIAITSGLPTISGMGVFLLSYLIVSKGIADIPPSLTLVTSAVCFLLGLLGLSYGILSSSWESSPGTLLGFENISSNINRIRIAFKSLNQANN